MELICYYFSDMFFGTAFDWAATYGNLESVTKAIKESKGNVPVTYRQRKSEYRIITVVEK